MARVARDFKTSKNLGELVRAGLTFSVVGSLFDPGAPRRSSLGLDGADEKRLAANRVALARFCSRARRAVSLTRPSEVKMEKSFRPMDH